MSSFKCEKCGALCSDTEKGYISGCKHYPPDRPNVGLRTPDCKPPEPEREIMDILKPKKQQPSECKHKTMKDHTGYWGTRKEDWCNKHNQFLAGGTCESCKQQPKSLVDVINNVYLKTVGYIPPERASQISKAIRLHIQEVCEGMKKQHKKDGDDCEDCGLFNIVKGEICDCEYNDALNDLKEKI